MHCIRLVELLQAIKSSNHLGGRRWTKEYRSNAILIAIAEITYIERSKLSLKFLLIQERILQMCTPELTPAECAELQAIAHKEHVITAVVLMSFLMFFVVYGLSLRYGIVG